MAIIKINTANAPTAPNLLAQAVLHDSKYHLEISGQIGLNPNTGALVDGGIAMEVVQALNNVEAVLQSVGWTLDNLTKVRIFLVDMKDYTLVNEIYKEKLGKNLPSRTAVTVKELPLGASIEFDCSASGDTIKN